MRISTRKRQPDVKMRASGTYDVALLEPRRFTKIGILTPGHIEGT